LVDIEVRSGSLLLKKFGALGTRWLEGLDPFGIRRHGVVFTMEGRWRSVRVEVEVEDILGREV
jgi:hypothetical protein